MTTSELVTLLENGGAILVFVALLVTEVLVPKGRLDEVKAERDEWKRVAELNGARADALAVSGVAARDLFKALHDATEKSVKELE